MKRRATRQLAAVYDVLAASPDHPTADQLFQRVRCVLPRVSLGTVYRNLKKLAEEGLICEVQIAGQITRFDANTGRHYHIRCLGCGRVNDLPISVDRRLEEEAGRAMNYRVLGHQVEVLGVCPLCQSAGEAVDIRYQ